MLPPEYQDSGVVEMDRIRSERLLQRLQRRFSLGLSKGAKDERGAVGTYGSSGFEYLGANNDYMNRTAQVWFYEAPYDTMINQTQAEWKFGELMFLAEAQMAPSQPTPVERYHILGDPLLRVDAGPPAFNVTVNGRAAESGDTRRAALPNGDQRL
mgnify:CR=1 FL=1